MKIGRYDLTSSNASKIQDSSCRVRRDGVTLVLMHFGKRSNPLGWIRNNPQSRERLEFVRALTEQGLSRDDVLMILSAGKKGN